MMVLSYHVMSDVVLCSVGLLGCIFGVGASEYLVFLFFCLLVWEKENGEGRERETLLSVCLPVSPGGISGPSPHVWFCL